MKKSEIGTNDYVTIAQGRGYSNKFIYVKNIEWFDCEYYTVRDTDFELIIKKCGLDVPKHAVKLSVNWSMTTVSDIACGKYFINTEESTDEELIIPYN